MFFALMDMPIEAFWILMGSVALISILGTLMGAGGYGDE